MSKKHNRLGESVFDSLGGSFEETESLREIMIESILPPLWQPRQKFERERLDELRESIRIHGLLQPIVVEEVSKGQYRLISGERRYRAVKELGQKFIPARIIIDLTEQKRLQIQIAENLQREDITPIERARAVFRLFAHALSKDGKESADTPDAVKELESTLMLYQINPSRLPKHVVDTVSTVLGELGKSARTVARWVSLLKLPEEVKLKLDDPHGALTPKHAGEVLQLDDAKQMLEIIKLIEELGLSAEQTKELIKNRKAAPLKMSVSPEPEFFLSKASKWLPQIESLDPKTLQDKQKSKMREKLQVIINRLQNLVAKLG